MERTYERQRRAAAGSRSRSGKQTALAPRERRRLAQLAVSAALFALVFLGRGVMPGQWKELLGQNVDFAAAFASFGESLVQGEPVIDTLGELWVDVFAGGTVEAHGASQLWSAAPGFSQRLTEQLLSPGDPLGKRCAEWTANRSAEVVQPAEESAVPSGVKGRESAAAEPEVQAKNTLLGGEPISLQSELPAQPVIETAQAQEFTADGQVLPASVSLAYYELGLSNTVLPVSAVLTSDYGYRDHPVSGDYRFHRGVDLGAPLGSDILAFSGGTVEFTGKNDTCGLYLQIDHGNGVSTFYAHCSEIDVLDGDTVTAGQVVARVGETGNATGPHLHFALIKDGIYLDPLYYIEVE